VRRSPAWSAVASLALVAAIAIPAAASSHARPHNKHAGKAPAAASSGPGIGHVFVIVLENKSYDELYGASATSTQIPLLRQQGTLLTNYYGIGHLSNPNYLAMISGQGPNPQTQSDCQSYDDFLPSPAVFDPRGNGQALGQGCIYPSNVPTLPDQLVASSKTWRGYMEDMGNQVGREPGTCGNPAGMTQSSGPRDVTQSATPTDQYAARHNPFVYFDSIIQRDCHTNVVPLGSTSTTSPGLAHDLASLSDSRNFTFITPDLCHDGHDATCADPNEPGDIAGIDEFLSTWVPIIENSAAFQQDGLLVITTDESEWNQSEQDSGSCCGEQPGPDTPMPGITGIGGGLTGALVIGTCVPGGATDATAYNHYSLLRTIEDLFGVGHLGYAGGDGVSSFGPDVFANCTPSSTTPASVS
jgi:phosphatidylinositol-3-phosphatase